MASCSVLSSCTEQAEDLDERESNLAYKNLSENPTAWNVVLKANRWNLANAYKRSGKALIDEWHSDTYCRFEADSVRFEKGEMHLLGTTCVYQYANCGTYAYNISGDSLTIADEKFNMYLSEGRNETMTITIGNESYTLVLKNK